MLGHRYFFEKMKPNLRIDVKLANAYAEGVHPTSRRLRKKKAIKPSPLSSCKVHELTLAIREHNVSDNSETYDIVGTDEK